MGEEWFRLGEGGGVFNQMEEKGDSAKVIDQKEGGGSDHLEEDGIG
jgi:hypothetical protein